MEVTFHRQYCNFAAAASCLQDIHSDALTGGSKTLETECEFILLEFPGGEMDVPGTLDQLIRLGGEI